MLPRRLALTIVTTGQEPTACGQPEEPAQHTPRAHAQTVGESVVHRNRR